MSDRRSTDRRRVIKGCRVLFNNRASTLDCVVRNLSKDGARVQTETPHLIPDEFELLIVQEGIIYPCKVAWRRGDEIGVTFTGPPGNA